MPTMHSEEQNPPEPSPPLPRGTRDHYLAPNEREAVALIRLASDLYAAREPCRNDMACIAQMRGAASAYGAILAAADGYYYATLERALQYCHDAVRCHPSRWELLQVNIELAFRVAAMDGTATDRVILEGPMAPCHRCGQPYAWVHSRPCPICGAAQDPPRETP